MDLRERERLYNLADYELRAQQEIMEDYSENSVQQAQTIATAVVALDIQKRIQSGAISKEQLSQFLIELYRKLEQTIVDFMLLGASIVAYCRTYDVERIEIDGESLGAKQGRTAILTPPQKHQ